jgi:MoxR-like ATPase
LGDWQIYKGEGRQHAGIGRLPQPPPWRSFDLKGYQPPKPNHEARWTDSDTARGAKYVADTDVRNPVNAAMYLRRPLLVTGHPGVGKSTLAYSVAWELGLGEVLRWPITSGSTLKDGLYRYDAIGRLHDVNLTKDTPQPQIGNYLRLGPLGTAFIPSGTPRVLLIDEIDKAGLDLPNDLLSIFEEGRYEIEELARVAEKEPVHEVRGADGKTVTIRAGQVHCTQFPVIILTSNGEREFPPAFLRRCIPLTIGRPGVGQLEKMVRAQLGGQVDPWAGVLIREYERIATGHVLASDQLLNAIHLTSRSDLAAGERNELVEMLFQSLNAPLG